MITLAQLRTELVEAHRELADAIEQCTCRPGDEDTSCPVADRTDAVERASTNFGHRYRCLADARHLLSTEGMLYDRPD